MAHADHVRSRSAVLPPRGWIVTGLAALSWGVVVVAGSLISMGFNFIAGV